ncbi:AMP-binding protein, partial [Mycobacterium paraintracellulare]|uniref:AMP-binding protein n=1 Tax=Mycobacterium paraintracellulare TaxID=1138383 RepID=UPI0019154753
ATRVYGSTEFPTLCTSPPDAPQEVRAQTDGALIGAAQLRIVEETGQNVPMGDTGELVVFGPELFVAYLRDTDNSGTFTADGWFHTGDLASVDIDGSVTIRGRKKDLVLRGGENI